MKNNVVHKCFEVSEAMCLQFKVYIFKYSNEHVVYCMLNNITNTLVPTINTAYVTWWSVCIIYMPCMDLLACTIVFSYCILYRFWLIFCLCLILSLFHLQILPPPVESVYWFHSIPLPLCLKRFRVNFLL